MQDIMSFSLAVCHVTGRILHAVKFGVLTREPALEDIFISVGPTHVFVDDAASRT